MDSPQQPAPTPRLVSIDAYRGLVMILMMAEVLHLCRVAEAVEAASGTANAVWDFLCFHQSHVPWRGWSLHDLIQPSFSFLVGTSLAFSIMKRERTGQSLGRMWGHAIYRAIVLTLLGVLLRSIGHDETQWRFDDTLSQIGLGYIPLFAIALLPRPATWGTIALILIGWWAAFANYPVPVEDFDYTTVGVENDWEHLETGFAAHWQKNANLASDADRWLLNKFPRSEPFNVNGGGYVTLNFVPTLATMLLGLIAGRWLRDTVKQFFTTKALFLRLIGTAIVLYAAGWLLDHYDLCPSVKRIWTPAWVLTSGGLCFALMSVFYLLTDAIGRTRWPIVLVVVGLNSIAAYVMAWTLEPFLKKAFVTHLGRSPFEVLGEAYESLLLGGATLLTMWLILFWMYRRKLFLKI